MVLIVADSRLNSSGKSLEASSYRRLNMLLGWMRSKNVSPSSVEWRLIQDAYDQKMSRRADVAFLCSFLLVAQFRSRVVSHRWLTRWGPSVYAGFVAYDVALANTAPCPALHCWNSLVMLDSPVGDAARRIHSPAQFVEYPQTQPLRAPQGTAQWLREAMQSLLLVHVLQHAFAGSRWDSIIDHRVGEMKHPFVNSPPETTTKKPLRDRLRATLSDRKSGVDEQDSTAHEFFSIVVNCRGLVWKPVACFYQHLNERELVYGMQFIPVPFVSRACLLSWYAMLPMSDYFLHRTRHVAWLWWSAHINLMRMVPELSAI